MKIKLLTLSFALLVVCVALLGISCSKGKTARQETVEYRVLSSRLIRSSKFVKLSDKPVAGADTSPCTFKASIQHDCEAVLSGGTAVSYPKCSEEMNCIKSRIEVIRSDDDIPDGLKVKIVEHLGVKLGKVFAGGGGVLAAGPKEFDLTAADLKELATKFKAEYIVGVAATVDEYEIVYSSNAIGGDAAHENGGERKATVSVYKNIVPFSKIRLYSTLCSP